MTHETAQVAKYCNFNVRMIYFNIWLDYITKLYHSQLH